MRPMLRRPSRQSRQSLRMWPLLGLLATACGSEAATAPAAEVQVTDDSTSTGADTPDATEDTAAHDDAAPPVEDAAPPVDDAAPADAVPPEDAREDTTSDDAGEDAVSPPDDTASDDTATDASSVADPSAPGPVPWTQEDLDVAGYDVALYVPTMSALAPAVVLAPGFQLDGSAFASYARHLASHGVAVLVPTFGDSLFSAISHSTLADAVVAMVASLAADPRFDPTRLGAGGHSRGGKVALLAATRDDRIRASFNLDPVDSVGPFSTPSAENPSVTPELMADLAIPLGLVGSTRGAEAAFPGSPACAPASDNYAAYATAASGVPFVAVPPASGHNDFADPLPALLRLACKGGDDPAAVRAAARTWMTAFYRVHLAGDAGYAPWLVTP